MQAMTGKLLSLAHEVSGVHALEPKHAAGVVQQARCPATCSHRAVPCKFA